MSTARGTRLNIVESRTRESLAARAIESRERLARDDQSSPEEETRRDQSIEIDRRETMPEARRETHGIRSARYASDARHSMRRTARLASSRRFALRSTARDSRAAHPRSANATGAVASARARPTARCSRLPVERPVSSHRTST